MKNGLLYRMASFPLLPVLIAVIVPLQLKLTNPALFSGGVNLLRTAATCGAAALLLTLALGLVLRNVHRAGVLATIFVALLFFGPLPKLAAQFIERSLAFAVPPSAVLLAVFAVLALVVSKLKIPPGVTHFGNAVTVALLAYNTVLVVLETSVDPATPTVSQAFPDGRATPESPDIIHIVLDGYSRADVLAEIYEFDNTDFLDALERLGFAVADNAVTPYNQTLLTMNSVFHGGYLPSSPENPAVSPNTYRGRLSTSFRNNSVMAALSRMGYKTLATKSEYPPLNLEGSSIRVPRRGFSMTFVERTLYDFSGLSVIIDDLGLSEVVSSNSVLEIRDTLQTSLDERGGKPYFQFLHILAPHPPFDVDSQGRPVSTAGIFDKMADGSRLHSNDPKKKKAYRRGYVQKLNFINSEILSYLESVIAERQRPLLILLHGDHGGGMHLDQEDSSNSCLRERYLPLVAVYSSDGNLQKVLPQDINLVNLYRIVFDNYFATSLGMLPDNSEFASSRNPADRIPVTKESLETRCVALD